MHDRSTNVFFTKRLFKLAPDSMTARRPLPIAAASLPSLVAGPAWSTPVPVGIDHMGVTSLSFTPALSHFA
jgi:hypothetical protein